jgi:hypothetical protein
MTLKAFGSGSYVQCPTGTHHAVCVDVVDLGIEISDKYFNEKTGDPNKAHKVRFVWQINEPLMDDGRRFSISRKFTLSLNEKSALRKFLESWRGQPFTAADLSAGFDVEKLIGVNCVLQVLQSEDGKYHNVSAVMPLTKGVASIEAVGYVRVKDRPAEEQVAGVVIGATATVEDDDPLPF